MNAPTKPTSDKQLLVYMVCRVMKMVTVEGCTEEQAYEDPFDYAVDEVEVEQIDWEVVEVKEAP